MAITLQCPRCTHEQTIDEDRANSEVPCKICHHPITPSAAPKKKAAPKPAAKKVAAEPSDAVQSGLPPVQGSKPPAMPKSKPPRKRDDDEDDRKRPAPRRKSPSGDTGALMTVLLVGGGVALIAILCGGVGLGAYVLLEQPRPDGPRPIAQIAIPQPQPIPPIQFPAPNPPPIPFPVINPPPPIEFPVPNPQPFVNPNPPAPPPLDPNNPADLDRVFVVLKGPAQQRGQAINWLNAANTNHPRRAEVAKQLDAMVDESMNQQFSGEAFFNVYFKWATRESAPALMRVAENTRFTPWDNRHRQEAMRALARFKVVDAAPILAKRVADHFDRGVATEALIELGPVAEKTVLAAVNQPDQQAREAMLRVLQSYKTGSEKIVAQCIADIESPDNKRGNAALQWLVKNPVEPARKQELSKSLNKLMAADNCLANRDLVAALETWGTKENTPRLLELLDKAPPPFGSREAMRVLSKIRDPQSVKGIAKRLSGPGFTGIEARMALKEFGAVAEPAVIEVLNSTNDAKCRTECVRCLGEIGTKAISIPALEAMAARLPQDRLFGLNVKSAVTMINKRGL